MRLNAEQKEIVGIVKDHFSCVIKSVNTENSGNGLYFYFQCAQDDDFCKKIKGSTSLWFVD